MVSSEKKLANAMGSKTARACDSCITKRARWYCAVDDVFLCQFCDTLVHSTNPLARDHERVRLKIDSLKLSSPAIPAPTWHQGFTKKFRTPRAKNSNKHAFHRTLKLEETRMSFNPLHVVPETGSDEFNIMNSDDQYSHQVPVFDPFSGDLFPSDTKDDEPEVPFHLNGLNGLILPSDLELAEFAADVESLLGKSLDESFDIAELGMVDCRLNDLVKVEDEKCEVVCDGHVNIHTEIYDNIHDISKKSSKMLKLDYDGIIAGWDDDRSPWTTGSRPELDPSDCWTDCMVACGKMQDCRCGDAGMMMTRLDGGREARVSRYREKRRTRLFSKKIRYEVRKVNAEKRPRMKGRFVKRTSLAV